MDDGFHHKGVFLILERDNKERVLTCPGIRRLLGWMRTQGLGGRSLPTWSSYTAWVPLLPYSFLAINVISPNRLFRMILMYNIQSFSLSYINSFIFSLDPLFPSPAFCLLPLPSSTLLFSHFFFLFNIYNLFPHYKATAWASGKLVLTLGAGEGRMKELVCADVWSCPWNPQIPLRKCADYSVTGVAWFPQNHPFCLSWSSFYLQG